MAADVCIHIGLPKTGTTTIQAALDASGPALGTCGVLVPGGGHGAHRRATFDLIGQRVAGEHNVIPGAFDSLMEEVRGYPGSRVVMSEEELARARPRHVKRIVRALEGHEVFVVVSLRDLARTMTSAWQQSVVMGATTPWCEFAAGVRSLDEGSPSAGASFRLRHDALRVLDVWERWIPRDRIRVVTVPPPGAPRTLLLERFAAAAGIPAHAWRTDLAIHNDSLGVAETELIRRLNPDLTGRLSAGPYRFVIESGIRDGWQTSGSRPLRLPREEHGWVRARSTALVEELGVRGYAVYGDLADLVPVEPREPARPLDEVTDGELLVAAESALASLAVAHGRLWRRHRRAFFARTGRPATLAELVGSDGRAALFGVQRQLLRHSDDHPALARLVRRVTGVRS